jgi:hypothetical protein
MYKRRGDGTIVGVLIDFDLAVLSGSQSTNTERTGTMVFMALDLLASIAVDTYQLHLYRHDVESFLWVAIWVCGTYEGGKERQDASFKVCAQGDTGHYFGYKLGFLAFGKGIRWSKDHQAREKHLRRMILHLKIDHANGEAQRTEQELAILDAGEREMQRREHELGILDAGEREMLYWEQELAIQEAGRVVKPEVPESPESDYNRLESKVFYRVHEELRKNQK